MLVGYILSRVGLRWSSSSPLPILQYMGLHVFNRPAGVKWLKECICNPSYHLIIKSREPTFPFLSYFPWFCVWGGCTIIFCHHGRWVVFICLHITLSHHHHHYTDLSKGTEIVRYMHAVGRVSKIKSILSIKFIQYVGLCVVSLSNSCDDRENAYFVNVCLLIIIIKSEG